MILCHLGCGQEGKFQKKKSGKFTCKPSSNSCPVIKKKNSIGVAKAHANNLIPGWNDLRKKHGKDKFNPNKGKYTKNIKMILITERGHFCEKCQNSVWNELPITLELEHIDGNNKNNNKLNLLLLCPNCHSQTPTWRRKKTTKQFAKYSEDDMISAINSSYSLNECLTKLDLRWGSGNIILKIMEKHKLTFLNG